MNVDKFMTTAGMIFGGASFVLKGIGTHGALSVSESACTYLKIGSLLLPVAATVGIATKKIFDDMDWQPSKARSITIFTFTFLASTALASAASVGFGFTTYLKTGWIVSLTALQVLGGIGCVLGGLDYLFSKEGQSPSNPGEKTVVKPEETGTPT